MMAYTRWQAAKDIVYSDYINRKLDSSIEGLMKNAYTLVEEIGAITTGHNPTYHIVFAVGRGKSRKIYEGDLPLSSLMQAAQLQPVWKNSSSETSFKLRLVATEEIRKQWATQSSIVALDETALKEYTSIMDEISNLTYGNGKRITNEGNKFEIYRKYLIQKQDNKDKNLLSKIAQEVMSNTKSFAKGQDFEYSTTADRWLLSPSINLQEIADQQNTQIERYESLKSFMGSNPSLASLSTLISTLENICSTLEIDISGIQNKAQTILNSEIRADGSLQAMLKEEIEERLREELNQIFQ